jgi:hypothetical protein
MSTLKYANCLAKQLRLEDQRYQRLMAELTSMPPKPPKMSSLCLARDCGTRLTPVISAFLAVPNLFPRGHKMVKQKIFPSWSSGDLPSHGPVDL